MNKEHHYALTIKWTGNRGTGTNAYRAYDRDHIISANNKPAIQASSDPGFLGNPEKYNPEELLVASLSACHMLWFLHLCAVEGIVVMDYQDNATGTMIESADGSGRFSEVTLFPTVTITDSSRIAATTKIHEQANKLCFISNSCNFPVHHKPVCMAVEKTG